MDMEKNYPSNSHKFKAEQKNAPAVEERKKVESVANGKVRKKKTGFKLRDLFIPEDITDVKAFLIGDILVPAVKNMILDTAEEFLDSGSKRHKKRTNADRVSYRSYYRREDERDRANTSRSSAYSYDEIAYDTRGEAERVLMRMDEILEEYGRVRLADYYDLSHVSGEYTDNSYGWYDLRTARVERTRNGDYVIDLPKVVPLRK